MTDPKDTDYQTPRAQAAPVRLKTRSEFLRAAKGRKNHSALFTIQTVRRPDVGGEEPRVGFTVTKKVGGATERNRIKRRLREAVRSLPTLCMQPSHDYVIVARRECLSAPFSDMIASLNTALRRLQNETHRSSRSGKVVTPSGVPARSPGEP